MALRDQIRIMVVDDMSTSRGLITQALDSYGVQHVSTAADGNDALQSLARSPVHLVISDYNMPNMNGLHLLQHLRQGAKTAQVGFILITGRADQQVIDQGRKLRMNNFLLKPFETSTLRQCIETVVGPL